MTHWYVIRLKPGASREAPRRRGDDPEAERPSIVERALGDAGIACYLPRMRKDVIHHRTKKKLVKAFPLFTGYAFARLAPRDHGRIRDCDGVGNVLGVNGAPWPVPDAIVDRCREAETAMRFDETHEARVARGEIGRSARETALMRFPEGSTVRVSSGLFAGFNGQVKDAVGKGVLRVVIDMMGGLTPVEFEPDHLEIISTEGKKAA